jgi:predicted RND superfamily exporter protein
MKSENEQIKKELEELKAKYNQMSEEIKKGIDEVKTKYNQLIGEVRYVEEIHEKFERKLFYVSAILFVVVLYVYFPFFKNLWLSVDPFMRGVLAVLLVVSFPIWIWFIFNI